jgi:acyl-coenzyme A synthetase/AMP-(fatty) acid ligase
MLLLNLILLIDVTFSTPTPDYAHTPDFSSVRHAVSAGECLPAAIFHRFKERFGVEILDAIGSTEALHMFIANRPGAVKPGSSGTIIAGFEARIVDENNQPVPPGVMGNLIIHSDAACERYWNQHEKTRRRSTATGFAPATAITRIVTGISGTPAAAMTC